MIGAFNMNSGAGKVDRIEPCLSDAAPSLCTRNDP